MKIKKAINNNILCAVDEKGREVILTGRGIGYQRKTGENIDASKVEKIYRMEDKTVQRRLRELMEQIPLEHLELTEKLIAHIKTVISQPLNESLLITMADHISFAIKRKQEGVEFSNPLAGPVMSYYPTEYQLGRYCLGEIEKQYGIRLREDEASFLALHIVNAELNTQMSEMYTITELIEGILQVVEYYYGKSFDRDSLAFSRFVVHLRYFAQRIFQNKTMPDTSDEHDVLFRQLIARNCKQHYKCACCIADYVRNTCQKELSDEELIYLTIHLKRVASGDSGEIAGE
ncbi:MAG: BglG family transcription antiterminator LicT [Gemmiger sp.]